MYADELRRYVERRARELSIPGAAVAVVNGGDEQLVTTGVTNVDAPVAVDEHTLFMIGSTTKTLTATALLGLADDGALDLDAPVVAYLPDLRLADTAARDTITTRHLLTHTAGFLGDVGDDDDWCADALARHIEQYVDLPQLSPPGMGFSYCNAGFRLAGRLVEVLCDTTYDAAIRERVLAPLALEESWFLPWEVFSRRHAVGHAVDAGVARVAHSWGLGRAGLPSGGLASTAADQLNYLRFHLEGRSAGKPPVTEPTRLRMQTRHSPAPPPFDAVALPWLLIDTHGVTLVCHGGNVGGVQMSSFAMLPGAGFGVLTLTNAATGGRLASDVTDWCLEHLLGLTPKTRDVLTPSAATLGEYTGRYDAGTWTVDIAADGDGVRATATLADEQRAAGHVGPPPVALVFVGPDEVARRDDLIRAYARFRRSGDGTIDGLYFSGRAVARVQQ